MNSGKKEKKSKRPQSSEGKSNNDIKDSKILPSNIRQDSAFFLPKEFTSQNMPTSNFPSVDNNRSKSVAMNESNDYKGDYLNEEYSAIQKIWEDLGITFKYQTHFDNYIRTVSESKIKNIFINERKNLKRFGEAILKLSKEINSRENNIHSLQRYIFSLINSSNYFEDEEDENIKKNRESIISNIISLVKSLRLNSVNVITHFLKVREIVTYYNLVGKIHMKLINKDYKYDEKYLGKMRNDMDFLKNIPKLSKYFDMNNSEIDAFLTNFAPKNRSNLSYSKINNNKAKIPVSDDLKKAIAQCRYILIQESFFDNMKGNFVNTEQEINNNNYKNFNNSNIYNNNNSKINNISGRSKNISKIQFFKDEDENQNIYQNQINYNNYSNLEEKEIKKVIGDDKYNLNRSLEFLRKNMGKEYDILFLKNKEKYMIKNRTNNFNNNENNNIILSNNQLLFRKPHMGGGQIIIEREEKREKPKMEFKLKNNYIYKEENPLIAENEELNRQLDEVCAENESLNKEINQLKKYVINLKKKLEEEEQERERIGIKKHKEIAQKELESEIKYKELDKKKDILIHEKKELNQKIKETKTLMEKNIEENKRKINELNLLMQKQKEEYERKIEEKNNEIKNLNNQKENLINEKNEIIKQKEQVINEKNQLIADKKDLEDKINGLGLVIDEYKNEMEKYKQLQINYENLLNKTKEMQKTIGELNEEIQRINQEKINLQNEAKIHNDEMIIKMNELQLNGANLNNIINSKENEKQNLIKEKDNLISENNKLKDELKNANNTINKLNDTITELETKISELTEELNELKGRKPDDTYQIIGNYKYDFYKGNLFNFITTISEDLALNKIPDFIKNSFGLEKINIFDESTYIKGVYPKIITSCLKTAKTITAICSLYYENYGQIGEPLILRIEALCVLEKDWEEQIENIMNYIKEKMIFDEIKYVIYYTPSPEHENKLRINDKIKDFFKTKLNCVWKNLTNYSDGSRTQDIRFIKEGNYFDQESSNYNNNNSKIFGFSSLSILSLFELDERSLEEGIGDEIKKKYSSIGFNRFINLFPIFVLLANNPTFKMMFNNENDANIYEIPKEDQVLDENNIININPKNQIRKLSEMLFNIDDVATLKEKINLLELLKKFDMNDSLFEEINNKMKETVENISFSCFSMNLNLSTSTNYCLEFENYYYNRISSKDIEILRDPGTKNFFYLIPTKTESTFFLICQVSRRLKEELLDKHKNIYETFMEYHPKLTNQLIQFSSFGLSTSEIKNYEKTIYIPSFKIDTHLYSCSIKDINKKGNIIDEKTGGEGNIGSIEEYFTMSFEEDKSIKNAFSIIPVEDNKMNMVIREPFLFGIFNINIISSTPLQLFYVTQDHWIKAKV